MLCAKHCILAFIYTINHIHESFVKVTHILKFILSKIEECDTVIVYQHFLIVEKNWKQFKMESS